jgi:acyl-CoA thioesterase YciA
MDAVDANDSPMSALRAVAMPMFANSHGDIFGGWLFSQMDLAGGTVATRRAKGRVVAVAITAMRHFVGERNDRGVGKTSLRVAMEYPSQ